MNKTKKSSLILFLICILFFSNAVLAQDNSAQMKDFLQQLLDNKLVELELYGIQAAVFYSPEEDYSLALISNISIFDQINVINDLVEIISVQN